MKFELFRNLYSEALDYESLELYIGERGWQEWMEKYDPADYLPEIYKLATSELKETRERKELSRAAFSRLYGIPVRTVENWDNGSREAPVYVKLLIDYSLFITDVF
ncbi:hypothetical protein BKP56_07265 [Marinilactibacillus sp. 15R]|uniref:helix-turn-helix domain-containing protein n=1 Tax=Marinilactibacillus sp. 15R TaxID=1911586 RepID=UPI000909D9F4|nr:hypothetical protein [Marinilactibacillus sp. 15R]API90296.1 hypothetical protein BKP56_07265 [Marinilactibacillus sp. 15R]